MNVHKRLRTHQCLLRNNKHHSIKLQNHVNKYGLADLTFLPFAECQKEDLIPIEQEFISLFEPFFNVSPIAGGGHTRVMPEEMKHKISLSHMGIRPTEATRKLLSEQRKGNKFGLGHKPSEGAKQKNREAHIGKKWTDEHRRKHSERMSGKNNPFYGKHHSDETRKLISTKRHSRSKIE